MDVRVDARELKALARDLKSVDPVMRKQLPKRLRKVAKPIRDDAQARAAEASSHIKVAIRSKLAGRNGATVNVVGRSPAKPPIAGLMERGSKGSAGRYIRHPVYGHDVWVNQPAHPYLLPALDAHRGEVIAEMVLVLNDVKMRIVLGRLAG